MSTGNMQLSTHKLFIQMSGAPGSGKSTMSRLLGRSISNTIIIDHDILRSGLIESGMSFDQAAKTSYQLQWKLARDFMEQGFHIIVDSTCNYQTILDQGTTLAKDHGYKFWYVECKVQDIDILDQRLRSRRPMTSQRTGVYRPPAAAQVENFTDEDCHALFEKWIHNPCIPMEDVIVVDSTEDAESARDHILSIISK